MGASQTLRDTGRGNPVPQFTGVGRRNRGDLAGNQGTSDVRGSLKTRVITLKAADAGNSFKLKAVFPSERVNELTQGKVSSDQTTVAFVIGTNATAADVQAALRTSTGDADLTVSGSTDTGPFTVTQGDTTHSHRAQWELVAITVLGMSVSIASTPVAYSSSLGLPGAAHKHGTDTGVPTASAAIGRGVGTEVPLGQSIVTDGGGQTAQTTLVAPVIDSAVGGDDQVVISGTEAASGGTGAVVGYSIFKTLTDDPHSTVYQEDADGDVTVTGLASGIDYYVVGFTQTVLNSGDPDEKSRVSRATAPEFFTTT